MSLHYEAFWKKLGEATVQKIDARKTKANINSIKKAKERRVWVWLRNEVNLVTFDPVSGHLSFSTNVSSLSFYSELPDRGSRLTYCTWSCRWNIVSRPPHLDCYQSSFHHGGKWRVFFFICFDHDRLAVNVNVTKWGRTSLTCSVFLCSVFLPNFSNF